MASPSLIRTAILSHASPPPARFRHMTFGLQQLFQISLEAGSASTMASKDFFTWAGKSSASMFCHFNSSRAIVLLQLGRTKRAYPIHLNAIKRLLQEDGYAA